MVFFLCEMAKTATHSFVSYKRQKVHCLTSLFVLVGSAFPLAPVTEESTPSRGEETPQRDQTVAGIGASNQSIKAAQDLTTAIMEKQKTAKIRWGSGVFEFILLGFDA